MFLFISVVVAFSVAYNQNKQLIGESGLMPCKNYLNSVKRYVGGKIGFAAFAYTPSILWLLDWSDMDANLDGIALVGMALAAFVLLTGMANMVIMVTLWVLYHSLVNVGQLWWVVDVCRERDDKHTYTFCHRNGSVLKLKTNCICPAALKWHESTWFQFICLILAI